MMMVRVSWWLVRLVGWTYSAVVAWWPFFVIYQTQARVLRTRITVWWVAEEQEIWGQMWRLLQTFRAMGTPTCWSRRRWILPVF